MRVSLLVVSTLLIATFPLASRGEDAPTPARALFNEGRELVAKGDFQAACPKFEQSLSLEGGLGTQFNLADCWEHIGRVASAQALFLGAAASAKAKGEVEREQVLRDRATALAPRVSKLVIEVEATDPKLSVKRDLLPIEPDAWGKAVAVDPGTYEISAKAPHKKPWSKSVQVPNGSATVVSVTVPELSPLNEAPAPEAAAETAARPTTAKPPAGTEAPPPSNGARRLNYTAIGLGSVGLVALGVGSVMGLRYQSANDDAKSICPSSTNCTSGQIDRHTKLVDRAKLDRTVSYIGFGVGGASLLGAAAWLLLDRGHPGEQAALHATPQIGPTGLFGATLDGSF